MIRISRRVALTAGMVMTVSSCTHKSNPDQLLIWQRLPDLPHALGGQMAGVHNDALVVAGGSYFDTPPWDGGPKRWVDTVFVLAAPGASWRTFHLPAAFGYAASVNTPQGFFLIGGGDSEANRREVLRLTWDGAALEVVQSRPLPIPLANCAGGFLNGKAYVVGGQQQPMATAASSTLLSLDLSLPQANWIEEPPLPGGGRILPSVGVVGNALYVVSGATLYPDPQGRPARRYLRDAWRFRPGTGWEELPPPPRASVAAAAHGAGQRFLIFGGDDGRYAAQTELREQHPGFPREVLSFHTRSLNWQVLDEMPAGLVTTTATHWQQSIVIPGGEDRPAHRSAEVHACRLAELRP